MYIANPFPALQYDFTLDGGRTNQLLSVVNNTVSPLTIQAVSITTNASIQNPWQVFGAQWSNVSVEQQGNFYTYTLALSPSITLAPGENKVLEYSVGNALGPITNVAMPPVQVAVQVQGNTNWQVLSSVVVNNPQPNPQPNKEFNMYHAEWGQYGYARNMSNEYWSNINCLTYAFIGFDAQGNVFSLDSWGDQLELPSLAIDKQAYSYLKTSISFGGWTNNGQPMAAVYSQMAADPTARANFIQNAVNAVIQAGVNGIDIDWEYPTASDTENYILLLQELRAALTAAKIPNARLTIAAPAGSNNINLFTSAQWQTIAATVDRISVMSYDYFGAFSDVADFHSPWALSSKSPHAISCASFCTQQTFALYQQMGVPENKLTMGIPNYARSMIVASAGQYAGLYQPVLGAPQGDFPGANGIYSWNTICNFLNKQPSALDALGVMQWYQYDSTHPLCIDAGMCLLSGQLPNGQWVVINYLDQTSATARAQQANSLNLGGVMEWANYFEPLVQSNSITQAVSQGLNFQLQYQARAINAPTRQQKTAIDQAVSQHANYLHNAFFAEGKEKILNQMSQANNNMQMSAILNKNRKTLEQHRNIFKRFVSAIVPDALANLIFDKPRSLQLAEQLLEARQTIEWTRPSKIISGSKMQPDIVLAQPLTHSYQRIAQMPTASSPLFANTPVNYGPPPTYSSDAYAQANHSQQFWNAPQPSAPAVAATYVSTQQITDPWTNPYSTQR